MPEPTPTIGIDDAIEQLRRCLAPGGDDRIGVEIEWIVHDVDDPSRSVPADEALAAADGGPLPHGGRITVEPGGQLELSALPQTDPSLSWRAAVVDADEIRRRMRSAGLDIVAIRLDPHRSSPLSVDDLRYRAIEESFSGAGPSAMHMATNSAGLQLNVDLGPDPMWTWRLANVLGPVLLAMFANSPAQRRARTGWASTRQLLWQTVPERRSQPVPTWSIDAWIRHALEMQVLFIRIGDDGIVVRESLSFERWLQRGHPAGFPTAADLDTHLTTLFPPVRPRGWLELRMIDSIPDDGIAVALAIAGTVLRDRDAGAAAAAICLPIAGRWADAARFGCADPELAAAATRILAIASSSVGDEGLAAACDDWARRYPLRHRSPADDRIDELTGGLLSRP